MDGPKEGSVASIDVHVHVLVRILFMVIRLVALYAASHAIVLTKHITLVTVCNLAPYFL